MQDIPDSTEAITADWLNLVLSQRFPNVDIEAVRVARQVEGTNRNALLKIDYRNSDGAPTGLFAKMAPADPRQRELVKMSKMAARETGFYRDLTDATSLRVPQSYFSAYDEESGNFLILLEDLVASGAAFPKPDDGFSLTLAEGMVSDLAELHTSALVSPDIERKTQWVGPPTRLKEYGVGMLEAAMARCADTLGEQFIELARVYCNQHDSAHDAWDKDGWALIHGDCHWGNLFVAENRIGFLDWGLMAKMTGIRDLTFFLCLGMDIEGRRLHEARLINLYREHIKDRGGPEIGEQEAWQHYRLHAAYTVAASAPAAAFPLIREQSDFEPAVVDEFLARATAAIRDLDAQQALLEAMD